MHPFSYQEKGVGMSSKMLLQATTSPLAPLLVGEGKRVLQCLTDIKMHPFSYQEKGSIWVEFIHEYLINNH